MAKAKKFGAFGGVFTPSILTILGVIMFLRLPWIVGQAGLWSTLGIILVAHIISAATGLSVASVATDKRVETGGSYYIISRSLGLPIGGTLGMALFVGLSFSVSLYLIGFAETFLSYFGFEVSLMSIRIAGSIILFLVAAVTFISTSLAIKTQYLIMAAMVLSLVSVLFGKHDFVPQAPLFLSAQGGLPWIALFAIFFPAVTGFEAGVSMSGDLKDPRRHIPAGTIGAILVGLVVYVGLAFFFSFTVERELLISDPRVLFQISWIPQLVIAGILGATLSSALGSILGAPRILQAVAADRILPRFFAKGFGASNEPRNALLLTYAIAQAGILIGELNVIARVVTIFFIITYGFLNITYFVESWAGSDFRPSFRIPAWVSIIGALACIIVMIQLDLMALVGASVVLVAIFLFLKKKELTLQTGDTWNSIWASLVKTGLGKLTISSRKARNWRPNVILFSGGQTSRPHLVEMGKSLVGKLGIFTNFELVEKTGSEKLPGRLENLADEKPLKKDGVFVRRHECRDVYEGIDMISRVYGFSGFEPNTILMGWAAKTNRQKDYVRLLDSFAEQQYNTVLLRYDSQHGFGKYRSIDFWWSGSGRGLSLAIALLRFLTSSKEWRGARIRILVINNNSSRTEALYTLVNQLLDNSRLAATVKVINNGVEQLPEADIMHAESAATDLCLFELPPRGKMDPLRYVEEVNLLTRSLRSCLLIAASPYFDEAGVHESISPKVRPQKVLQGSTGENATVAVRPGPGVLQLLEPAKNELIANEVYNIGKSAEQATRHLYEKGFDTSVEKYALFFPELDFFAEKTLSNLYKTTEIEKEADQYKAVLRVLNDFSYHSQRHIQQLRDELIPFEKDSLDRAMKGYLREMRQALAGVPPLIRIRRERKDFVIHKDDNLRTKLYKSWKITQASLLRRPVSHKVNLLPAVRYFVFHRRLQMLTELANELALHAFRQTAEIRKVLTTMHEVIEKTRLGGAEKDRIGERIRLEKDRIRAKVAVLRDENQQFFYQAGQRLYDSLLEDLQELSRHLESTRANMLSRNFSAYARQDEKLIEGLEEFPNIWQDSLGLFINKGVLDFSVLSLKSRISSKIEKSHQEFSARIRQELGTHIDAFRQMAGDLSQGESKKLDYSQLKSPRIDEWFRPLFEEMRDLLRELPEKMEISGDQFAENLGSGRFEAAEPVLVNYRKTVSYYVSSELIDLATTHIASASEAIDDIVLSLRDQAKLVNFSFNLETDKIEDAEAILRKEQQQALIDTFTQRLEEESHKLSEVIRKLSRGFEQGLKAAFDPLSSATISRTSTAMRKKQRKSSSNRYARQLQQEWRRMQEKVQQHLVDLLYSRSEGLLWLSRMEKTEGSGLHSFSDTLAFVEAISPRHEVVEELPFYYRTLFSGQSGTGDDFWVGMQAQMDACDRAIERFKAGFGGALIITGLRSSGKSSLSKKMARKHFAPENIHPLRAPKGCAADVELFSTQLRDTLQAGNERLDDIFRALPPGKVIVIQDLGLWWERRQGGNAVIELIQQLIDKYGHKCLFIINVNTFALEMIDRWCSIRRFALDTVSCEAFDARELKELLLLRHQAGGLKMVYGRKEEASMSALDYARMFNRLFEQSFGNPGTALMLWKASIKKISGKTIYIEPLDLPSTEVFARLSRDQWFYLIQFVTHRRFSIGRLAENLERDPARVYADIRELVRAGILVEKFEGIYAIRSGLDLYITDKLNEIYQL